MKKRYVIEMFSYPLVGLIYVVSWLPLSLLYKLSLIIFFLLYYFPGYRKQVVYNNLSGAFPEKTSKEVLIIRRKFYLHISKLFVEVLKLLRYSPAKLNRRCRFTPEAEKLINSYLSNNRSVFLVMGHYGNWEWTGTSFFSQFGVYPISVYKPVKNRVIDRLLKKIRTRYGVQVYPMKEFPRQMFAVRNKLSAVILIADQTPSKSNAHWVNFLNRETPVFKGTARLSKMFNYPLILCFSRPSKPGYYDIYAKLITEKPKDYDEETISLLHSQMLEKEIIHAPQYWLWTHKRWKHKRDKQDS